MRYVWRVPPVYREHQGKPFCYNIYNSSNGLTDIGAMAEAECDIANVVEQRPVVLLRVLKKYRDVLEEVAACRR